MIKELADLKTVCLNETKDAVVILDQTLLPEKEIYVSLFTEQDIWDAIFKLKVRGAPAIGIAAAYGIYICSSKIKTSSFEQFYNEFCRIKVFLSGARPTAVNLVAALDRMERRILLNKEKSVPQIKQELLKEALAIREEDATACRQIGENSLALLRPGMGVLTHCNAGHLAVSEYGTALAPVYLGQERGFGFKVFADETRPLLQGARLTTYELQRAGVDVTLICDNMVSSVMQKGWVQAVLVGCDRIAANGDVANKIGTSGVAVLARYYGIPFYVLGPTSTIDMQCPDGKSIVIEERHPEEVTDMWYNRRMAPEKVKVYNPAFDVTPRELITAIITEKGVW
ncbi:S-methyl-5-thioribose-1-phosphate isomerase [Parabacteroides chinchillae]